MVKTKDKQPHKRHHEEVVKEKFNVEAYYHWLERGCPMGDDLTDWVEVERKYVATARHN